MGNQKLVMKTSKLSSFTSPVTDMEVAVKSMDQKRSRKGGVKNGKATGGSCGGAGDQFEHEMHIWTERERRKKMRNMFSSLHALLPQLPDKADKSSIVDEAVKYIKTLQHTLQTLENQKMERLRSGTIIDYEASMLTTTTSQPPVQAESREAFLADQVASKNYSMVDGMPRTTFSVSRSPACFQTWFSPNVVINTCGNEAQISVCSPRKRRLLTTIVYILEKHNLEVVSAHVSSDQYRSMYMIHVQAAGGSGTDQVSDTHTLSVEEIFKLAAGEMNLWLLTCT